MFKDIVEASGFEPTKTIALNLPTNRELTLTEAIADEQATLQGRNSQAERIVLNGRGGYNR